MSKQQTKKRSSFIDRPIVGLTLLVLINVIFVSLLFLLQRYVKISPKYFVMGIGIAMVTVLVLNAFGLLGYAKRIQLFRRITFYAGVAILLVSSVTTFYLYRTNSLIDKIIDPTGVETVEYSVVSFNKDIDETMMDGKNIGYVASNDDTIEQLIKDTIQPYSRSVEYVEYTTEKDLLSASLKDEIQFGVLPKSYTHLAEQVASEGDPFENSKQLFTISKKVTSTVSNVDVVKEPFSILMIGVNEGLSDSLIYATYNPKTLKVTMTSIARDSYVPIACRNDVKDKINHSSGVSRQCLLDTVENFLDEEIDFYFEVDFYALVKIVDAIGGLDIESPVTFAGEFPLEDQYHDNGKPIMEAVTVPAGMNHLDGKQVLTFARERRTENMPRADYDRQMNQQYVIKELASSILATRNPNTLLNVLDAAKDNIQTNLPMASISALMGHAIQSMDSSTLTPMETFRFSQSQIAGEGYMPNGTWYSVPYASDVRNARTMIDLNMMSEPKLRNETSFEFTYSKPYDVLADNLDFEDNFGELWTVGGLEEPTSSDDSDDENPRNEGPADTSTASVTVPSFIGMSESDVRAWGNSNGITINVGTVSKEDDGTFDEGQFWAQSVGPGETVEEGSSIYVEFVTLTPKETPTDPGDGGSEGGDGGSDETPTP